MSKEPLKLRLNRVNQVPATCMGMHVRRASRIVTQVYDAVLRPAGLALNQFTLLVSIHLHESISITHLAEKLFTDQTTITRNLKLLEKRGWVAIKPGEDRRVKFVSLTGEGQAVLTQALPLWEQAQVEVENCIGQQQIQVFLSMLSEFTTLTNSP